MAEPAGSFSEGDPRNAQYFETLAQLRHQYEGTIGEIGGPSGETGLRKIGRENAKYAEGQIAKQEPTGFRNLRNQAGKEGLTHSGILGGRTGSLASQYATRRYGVTRGLAEQENEYTNKERQAKEKLEGGNVEATGKALEARKEWLLNNPNAAVEESMMPGGKPASTAAAVKPPAAPSAVPTARVIGRQRRTGGVHGAARRVAARKMFASTGGVKAP